MISLAYRLWHGMDVVEVDKKRSELLLRQAALLGEYEGQLKVALNCCGECSVERFEWLRRAALQEVQVQAQNIVLSAASQQWQLFAKGGTWRIVFEIGASPANYEDWNRCASPDEVVAGEASLALYSKWRGDAKRAVWCWLWLARDLRVVKDVRLMIADLIWNERFSWSDKATSGAPTL